MSILPFMSLAGSLTPYGVLTQAERENALRAEELARRTTELQSVAGQAQQTYGEAAAAPPPGYLPGDTFTTQLLGVLGSVITQQPQYQEAAQAEIKQRRAALMEVRTQNLVQLRDVANERAQLAREAGNLEEAFKNMTVVKKLDDELDQASQQRQFQFQAEQNRLGREASARSQGVASARAERNFFRQALFQITTAYNADPAIKKYEQMNGFLRAGKIGYEQNNGLGDVAMVFAFMRALEPGNPNSVREGEAKNVADAVGMLQRYQAQLKGLLNKKGDRFLPEGRRAVMRYISTAANDLRPDYDASQEQFGLSGALLGIPLENFMREIKPVEIDPEIFVEDL